MRRGIHFRFISISSKRSQSARTLDKWRLCGFSFQRNAAPSPAKPGRGSRNVAQFQKVDKDEIRFIFRPSAICILPITPTHQATKGDVGQNKSQFFSFLILSTAPARRRCHWKVLSSHWIKNVNSHIKSIGKLRSSWGVVCGWTRLSACPMILHVKSEWRRSLAFSLSFWRLLSLRLIAGMERLLKQHDEQN